MDYFCMSIARSKPPKMASDIVYIVHVLNVL